MDPTFLPATKLAALVKKGAIGCVELLDHYLARVEKLDGALIEAAHDLGAGPWRVFPSVILPLTLPGIAAGALQDDKSRFPVTVPGLIRTAQDLFGLPVKVNNDTVVTLGEVTTVRRTR